MNPDSLNFITYVLFGLFIWLSVVTYLLLNAVSNYKKLTRNSRGISLEKVLENLITSSEQEKKRITEIANSLIGTQKHVESHLQKFSLVRFNPFEDAGGDQSFCIALLDGNNNGVVISSLHSRSGTRVYAKSVVAGRHSAHAFTKEEKEAVEKAAKKVK